MEWFPYIIKNKLAYKIIHYIWYDYHIKQYINQIEGIHIIA